MISYADKYSQVIVSQTLESESADYEAAKRNPYGEINPNKFLQSIINWKTNISHIDYVLAVSPMMDQVSEDGIANEISWGTHILPVVCSSKNLYEYVDDTEFKAEPIEGRRRYSMVGGFVNSSHTNVPNWGSHS
jgi:hypothetical protein